MLTCDNFKIFPFFENFQFLPNSDKNWFKLNYIKLDT